MYMTLILWCEDTDVLLESDFKLYIYMHIHI